MAFSRNDMEATAFVACLSERGMKPVDIGAGDVLKEVVVEKTGKKMNISEALYKRRTDPGVFISLRTLLGGPAPEEVKRQLEDAKARL
ncbi:hypothetical protein JSY36_08290 [Bacillus sp. H-16]|uniref:hypothetical protein n=1 Tax=Alteribacter salitolerans TaxID=2912333 RepID=UPI0019635388|nr:hypothetical protein [Alteribacter salitolerans]MBM7095750.1 hypothetical protein [Alteribacter salitolerans]